MALNVGQAHFGGTVDGSWRVYCGPERIDRDEDKERALASGANACMHKPFDEDTLLAAVSACLPDHES